MYPITITDRKNSTLTYMSNTPCGFLGVRKARARGPLMAAVVLCDVVAERVGDPTIYGAMLGCIRMQATDKVQDREIVDVVALC